MSGTVSHARCTASMSAFTSSARPLFSAPRLITMSISRAPTAIAAGASNDFAADRPAPSGKPTTAQTRTPVPASARAASGTFAEFTQTE